MTKENKIFNDIQLNELLGNKNMWDENSNQFYCRVAQLISLEERLYILDTLYNKNCLNCDNSCCKVPLYEKLGNDEFGMPQEYKCLRWNNDEYIGKAKVLKIMI